MVTNILISHADDTTTITWFYGDNECKLEIQGKRDPEDIIDWVKSMPKEEQEEYDVDYVGRTLQDEGSDPEYYSDMLND